MASDQLGFDDLIESYSLLSDLKDESKFLLIISLSNGEKSILDLISGFEDLFDRLKNKYSFDSVEDLVYHYQAKNLLSGDIDADKIFQERG